MQGFAIIAANGQRHRRWQARHQVAGKTGAREDGDRMVRRDLRGNLRLAQKGFDLEPLGGQDKHRARSQCRHHVAQHLPRSLSRNRAQNDSALRQRIGPPATAPSLYLCPA